MILYFYNFYVKCITILYRYKWCYLHLYEEDEIIGFLTSDEYDANTKYSFIIENQRGVKAICYNCGRPNMGIAQKINQISGVTKGCSYLSLAPDIFAKYAVYEIERCTVCGFENIIKQKFSKGA